MRAFQCRIFSRSREPTQVSATTALELAEGGAEVIMACRNKDRCDEARQNILDQIGQNATISTELLDLSSFKSIRQFSHEFQTQYKNLDILINNAGIMALPVREIN